MTNESTEPAWSGYEQEIPVAQETANDLENVTCAGLSNADERHAALDKLVNVASNYAPEVFYDWIQETGISLRAALQSPSDKRLQDHIDYSIDLQRIIESLCHGEEIIKPKTTARHHYDMAVAYKAALQSPRVPVNDGLDRALEEFETLWRNNPSVAGDECLSIIYEAARAYTELPKMQKVDLEMAYKNFPEGDDIYSLSPHDRGRIEGYNRAIDDIKAKYGDLYEEVK